MSTIDVVIPVHGHAAELLGCLTSLAPQCTEGVRIVVVDNGAEPSLGPVCARFPTVVCLHQPVRGSYAARNLAIARSAADYVAFTDADCIPDRDWLQAALRYFAAHPGARILGGAIEVFPRGSQPNAVEAYQMVAAFPVESYVKEFHFAPTANLVVERSVFAEIGLFEEVLSGGDLEWGQRAFARGIAVRFVPDLLVRHPARRTLSELVQKEMRVTAGQVDLERRRTSGRHVFRRRCRELVWPPPAVPSLLTGAVGGRFPMSTRLRIAPVFLVLHFVRVGYGAYRAATTGLRS